MAPKKKSTKTDKKEIAAVKTDVAAVKTDVATVKEDVEKVTIDIKKEIKKVFDDAIKKVDKNPMRYSDVKHLLIKIRELLE